MNKDEILLNKDIVFNEGKGRAKKDDFYILYLCDFEKGSRGLLKAVGLPNGQSICVGKFRDGNMYEFMTDMKLDYVDDVDVIFDIGEEFYYFEKPCYVNCQKISIGDVAMFLNSFENDSEVSINTYKRVLNEQFRHAVSGYEEMCLLLDKHYKVKRR